MKRLLLSLVAILTCGALYAQMDVETSKPKRLAQSQLPMFKSVEINTNADITFIYVDDPNKCHIMYDLKGSFDTKFAYSVTADSLLKISERSVPKRKERSEVTIYHNRLERLDISKAKVVFNDPLRCKMVDFVASSSASLNCEMDNMDVKVSASGGSRVELSGQSRYVSVSATSNSTVVYLANLVTTSAWINATQGATVMVQPEERLVVKSTMGAVVKYGGAPEIFRAEQSLVGGEVFHVEEF
ncbi:MAG: DUF2807 domain-containing protein [Rikenellaceae bacterium]